MQIQIKRLPHAEGIPTPSKATSGASGFDLCAIGDHKLGPGERTIIPTGFIFEIPHGYEGQIRARSGRAYKDGITVLNGPGTIDSDFRGEVHVLLVNLGRNHCTIVHGDRIAQIVFAEIQTVTLKEIESISDTERGAGGFGHTGDK